VGPPPTGLPPRHPSRAKALARLGEALSLLGRLEESDARLGDALALDPGNPYVQVGVARALVARGRPAAAHVHARAAVAVAQRSYDFRQLLGMVLLRSGDPAAALVELDLACGLTPVPWEARFNRGQARESLGRLQEALDDYVFVVRTKPDFEPGLAALGQALLRAHRPDLALEPLRSAVALDPKDADAHLGLGLAAFECGKNDEARRELSAALPALAGEQRERVAAILAKLPR
jgi:superkiller protein 3